MKTQFSRFLIALLSVGVLLTGCKDDEDQNEMVLDEIVLNMSHTAYSEQIELPLGQISNYWHVYSPSADTWLVQEVVPGRKALYVQADGNTTGQIRSSYIMVRSGRQTQRIVVNQDSDKGISLSQNRVNVSYEAAAEEITINSVDELDNIVLSVESKTPGETGWLSATLDNDKISIAITFNSNETAREGTVTVSAVRRISGEPVTDVISVYQNRGGKPYMFDIPSDFTSTKVYTVIADGKPIAQIAKELLRKNETVNEQAVVVYPINDAGEVELGLGYVAQVLLVSSDLSGEAKENSYVAPTEAVHGGKVSFSVKDNAISDYKVGTLDKPVVTVYYMPGSIRSEVIDQAAKAEVEPLTFTDKRNTEVFTYPVVKVGAQYWMGSNLKTACYNKNKNFEAIPTGVKGSETAYTVAWEYENALDPAAAEVRENLGLLYGYLAIGGYTSFDEAKDDTGKALEVLAEIEDNISPEGWIVPTWTEIQSLVNYTTEWPAVLGNPTAGYTGSDNDISGFGIKATYYYFPTSKTPWYNTSFYSVLHTRTRAADNGTTKRTYPCCINASKINPTNRLDMTRGFAIRCLNNGAVKIAE